MLFVDDFVEAGVLTCVGIAACIAYLLKLFLPYILLLFYPGDLLLLHFNRSINDSCREHAFLFIHALQALWQIFVALLPPFIHVIHGVLLADHRGASGACSMMNVDFGDAGGLGVDAYLPFVYLLFVYPTSSLSNSLIQVRSIQRFRQYF